MKTYRAAVIGLGNIAWKFDGGRVAADGGAFTHVSAFRASGRVELVGGFSPDREERVAFNQSMAVAAFGSLESMINEVHPDLVSVCSPTACHFDHVAYCLAAGVPMIWLEKPPTVTLEELDRLRDLACGRETRILVNYQRRYDRNYDRLRDSVQRGEFGPCRGIDITYSRGLELNGSHMLDTLFRVLGDGVDCGLEWVSGPKSGDNPSFVLQAGGIRVMVTGLELPYHCIDFSVVFDCGRVSVLHGGMTPRVEQRREHELFPGFYRLFSDDRSVAGAPDIGPSLVKALQDLIAAHETGSVPLSNLASARRTLALLRDIRAAQARGRS